MPICVKQSGHHQSNPPPQRHCQAPREMQELGKTEIRAPCLQREAAYILRLREVGLVMFLKACLHAVLSGWWETRCHRKTRRASLNITLMLLQAQRGVLLQIERLSPPPQLKAQWLTISLSNRNKQAGCWEKSFTTLDPFCVTGGACVFPWKKKKRSEEHSMCWWVFIAHGAQQGLCLLHHAAQTHALHSSEQREESERGRPFGLKHLVCLSTTHVPLLWTDSKFQLFFFFFNTWNFSKCLVPLLFTGHCSTRGCFLRPAEAPLWIGCDVLRWYEATFINCKINQNTLEKTHLMQSSDNWMMNSPASTWVRSGLPAEVIAVYFIHCWSSITWAPSWPRSLIDTCRKRKRSMLAGTFATWEVHSTCWSSL